MAIIKLTKKDLRTNINLKRFGFQTTDEVEALDDIIGQNRAIRAIELALEMDHSGYNVFVSGMSGTGRTTIVENILKRIAKDKPLPSDWVYVYNFDDSDTPKVLEMAPCKGKEFKADMAELVTTLKKEIPATFDSEDYENQKLAIMNSTNEQKRKLLEELNLSAREREIQIKSTPAGFQTLVLKNNEPLSAEEYEKLANDEKQNIDNRLAEVQEKINITGREMVKLDRAAQKKIRQLNEKIASFLINHHIDELKSEYQDYPQVVDYLNRVSKDIITNISEFLTQTKKEDGKAGNRQPGLNHFKRYEVNVIVDNTFSEGAPVIYEPNPTYNNLFGRIDKQMIMGAQVTDFTMIKSGSLQRANEGYLMTEAYHVLKNPYVYDALKRAIKTRQIRIEDVAELSGFLSPAGLRPQPIPLNLKVILIGWNQIYYMLQAYDQDFSKIFKIRADFDYETHSTNANINKYARFIKKVCQEEGLLPFDKKAVREIVFYGHRLVDDQQKISLRFGSLVGIIREANHYARKDGNELVEDKHVKKAIEELKFRNSLIEEKIQEMYKRDIYKIDTNGEKVGQINGLAVYSIGDYSYGRPNKITSKTYIGSENVLNIERKSRLSGKIHDKGLWILSGFFNSKFGEYIPPSFSASITFEQSYSMIDGDSASSTELYALISSLANIPIKQGIAVTGSVNQNGEIQAIGGVNQKIEGYFAVCREKGLTGNQGVIIPRSNIENLMLKDDLLRSIQKGKFNIWAVDTIEDGLKILTGENTGERLQNGRFPKNTIYNLVENQLRTFAKRADAFKKSIGGKKKEEEENTSSKNNQNKDDN